MLLQLFHTIFRSELDDHEMADHRSKLYREYQKLLRQCVENGIKCVFPVNREKHVV